MKIAIMQPYVFPYLGYFQLVNAVDTFVFYDDVNFIKKGWINKNKILLSKQEHYITIPCKKVSQNKLINEIMVDYDNPNFDKLKLTFQTAYSNAPYYEEVASIFFKTMEKNRFDDIGSFAGHSIMEISNFLDLRVSFKKSSEAGYENNDLKKGDRLIDIVKQENIENYVNAIGGQAIYTKEYFKDSGINLSFLKPQLEEYNQNTTPFISGLSILDVLMYCSREQVRDMLDRYQLV